MTKPPKRPAGKTEHRKRTERIKDSEAASLGQKVGPARSKTLTKERRNKIAKAAAQSRRKKD